MEKTKKPITKPNIYIIMGEANFRKSSTIRALTGVRVSSVYNIATVKGCLGYLIYMRAVQEMEQSPDEFIKNVREKNPSNILLALRINTAKIKRKKYPNASVYIKKFLGCGWSIKKIDGIIALGVNQLPYDLPVKPSFIPDSYSKPANEIASEIRKTWRWL